MEGSLVADRPNVKWEAIAGLDSIKTFLKQAVTEPRKSCTVLLYGPPGTGKSLLVNAAVTEASSVVYFSASAYELRSDSDVKALFIMAKERQPSIMYFDDVDAFCEFGSEQSLENKKKALSEFIDQMAKIGRSDEVLVIAATMKPWRLDSQIIQAFKKCLFVGMPDTEARTNIFKSQIGQARFQTLTEEDFRLLSEKSEGYTGADITVVVRDALMEPVRKIQKATHFRRVKGTPTQDQNIESDYLFTPCSPEEPDALTMAWTDVPHEKFMEPCAEMTDLLKSLENLKPSVPQSELDRFLEIKTIVTEDR